jgi:hypothetical protein
VNEGDLIVALRVEEEPPFYQQIIDAAEAIARLHRPQVRVAFALNIALVGILLEWVEMR